MQLFVSGPAFGLPSIDAECIAAVALLQLHNADWSVVPTHERDGPLPFLRINDTYLEGFEAIAQQLNENGSRTSSDLIRKQRADSTALSSFVRFHARTLLDVSLYISSENYFATRSAYTKILPWYANYITPPRQRAKARKRTEHLGIHSIDVDDVHEDLSNKPPGFDTGREKTFEAETQKRASLLLPRKDTVMSLLSKPEHSSVFKLHALADNFFVPLQDMLGDGEYFTGSQEPTAVDCLIYGYLSLMLFPRLPHDWLAKTMRNRFRKLVHFVEHMHAKLQMETDAREVMLLANCKTVEELDRARGTCKSNLPWSPPVSSSAVKVTKIIAGDLIERIPYVTSRDLVIETSPKPGNWLRSYTQLILGLMATSFGLAGYYAFATGLLSWPHGEDVHIFGRKRFSDYGHLGAALAGVSLLGQQASRDAAYHHQQAADNPVQVEVQVEPDALP